MKCRRIAVNSFTGKKAVVWFGSCGKDANGHAVFYNNGKPHVSYVEPNPDTDDQEKYTSELKNQNEILSKTNRHDNYAMNQESVSQSLNQRLSVIRGELWYAINLGFPMSRSNLTKNIVDSYIINVISQHEDVMKILSFTSFVNKNNYVANVEILTRYGSVEFTQSRQI